METTEAHEPQNWREYRRLRTWEMHQQGYKQCEIAAALGLTASAVSRIIARANAGGVTALYHHKPPGRPAQLSAEQREQLLVELAAGAEAHGFAGNVWTTERIAQFIAQRFGVQYHRDYIGPLLRQLGWSVQRPIVRASQRNEAAIEQWVEVTWPELKKEP